VPRFIFYQRLALGGKTATVAKLMGSFVVIFRV